jgi:BRCT domain type II-containing protein
MLTKTVLAFCVLCAFVLIGCTKTDTMSNSNTTTTNSNKTTTTTTTTSTTSTTSDKIGVPECDDYIAKYEACVNSKVPEMARAQFNSAMKTARDAWRKAASTPEGKAGLAAACKQATESAKTSMKSYGCEF